MSPFSRPPNPQVFQAQVWEVVRSIPAGRVYTYGQIAAQLGPPPGVEESRYRAFGARWVGSALAACPDSLPWQRVVNAQGKISPRPGADLQAALLEAEGIIFDSQGRIDLQRYGWRGPESQGP